MSNLRLPSGQQVRVVIFSSLLLLTACGEKPPSGVPGEMKVPVSVVTVQPTPTEVVVELPGRVEAIKDAQIRARVNGIVTEINFDQGSDVKAGQLLFTIDPAPYRAVRAQAAAQLQRAEADAKSARLLAERYSKLIKANAVSRQEYDNAMAAAGQAEAAIAAAEATLQAADIDLGYTKVDSPIDGRIGKSLVTEGALVSATAATQLATVQQINRVYVDLTRSTAEVSQLRQALASGKLEQSPDGNAKAEVVLEDGSSYDQPGKVLFSGITVDPTTGQVVLRAEFPNPDQILLPGMYVRVRLQQGVDEKALLVPQQALQRTADGLSSLMLVRDGKVQVVAVEVGPESKGNWIITEGLNAGDVVIVEGFQKIRPGAAVQGMPWKPKGSQDGNASAPAEPGAPGVEKGADPSGDKAPVAEPGSKG
ncbi:efflux transporter periplasmic adaptor subunit [Pollutimonas nitritireducens]|uniref:Efflux transporter periplasmic adaptor subunit n=1 Tax=Pollutimonas nitritireducens TaxID=2045209 RepID=A0A2N4UGJ7_9BURK|nr:efflux RND transporter periplasmic adaptor subunit [Pollutimonas nitritireducens]PLC54144.1 efflux transporter periplasmic adaptor subunit [Pollutimonas nitritireducens]